MSKKLNILHIITSFKVGGAESSLYRLIANSDENHVVICLSDGGVFVERIKSLGVEVIVLNIVGLLSLLKGIGKLIKNIRSRFSGYIVQTWLYHADLIGGICAYLAGCKKIVWCIRHSVIRKGDLKFSTNLVVRLNSFFSYLLPTKIVYNSECGKDFHERTMFFSQRKGVLIQNGIDVDVYRPGGTRSENEKIVIGSAGRFDLQKNHHLIFRVCRSLLNSGLINFEFNIVGTNIDYQNKYLVNLISEYDVAGYVNLLGVTDDMPAFYNSLDIFILTSNTEAFPNVIAEAMSCGVVSLSTDVGDANHIIGNNERIAAVGDYIGLKNILVRLFELRQQKDKWLDERQAVRRQIVERFSIKKMLANYREVWID